MCLFSNNNKIEIFEIVIILVDVFLLPSHWTRKITIDFIITIKYTHEEFAPEFNTTDLKIYKLKRDYQNQENRDHV